MNPEEQLMCTEATKYALDLIRRRYEDGPENRRLAYHNRFHTEGVIRRAIRIAEALGLTEREKALVTLGAAFHDITHDRGRSQGENERASAYEFVFWSSSLLLNKIELPGNESELVKQAILATIVAWNDEYNTITQPNLKPDSHPVVRAVAMADVGTAGMEPQDFCKGSDDQFIEREPNHMAILALADHVNEVTKSEQNYLLLRYRAWMETQLLFVKGRKALFETELGAISEEAKVRMRTLFKGFDDCISFAENEVLRAKSLEFRDLAACLLPEKFGVKV